MVPQESQIYELQNLDFHLELGPPVLEGENRWHWDIGDRGIVRHKARKHRIHDIVNSDFPTIKGDHLESAVGEEFPMGN
jgi:hypothetical protein